MLLPTETDVAPATTMMTNVVVAPPLGGLLVGCVLLLTGTIPVVVTLPTVWGREVAPTACGGEVVSTV